MNQNKNINDLTPEERSAINDKIIRFGAILLAIAVIMYCFALAKLEHGFLRFLVSLIACIIGAVGIFIIVVVIAGAKAEKNKHNFFLYDRKKKQNIDLCELKVETVRQKISEFMSAFKIRGKLYIGDLFDDKNSIPEHFKTLFCYELLCQISENHADANVFLSFGVECANVFEKYLSATGNSELAVAIRAYIINFSAGEDKTDEFRDLIISKKELLETSMLNYTKENISKFG